MRSLGLIHNELLEHLSNLFQSECTIEEPTYISGDYNEPKSTWQTVYSNIPCYYGKNQASEKETSEYVTRHKEKKVILKGVYAVDKSMRVFMEDQYFEVIDVQTGVLQFKTVLIVKDYES